MKYFNIKERRENKKQEKLDYLNKLKELENMVKVAVEDYNTLFYDATRYIELSDVILWKTKYKNLHDQVSEFLIGNGLSKSKLPNSYENVFEEIPEMFKKIAKKRSKHNRCLIREGLEHARDALLMVGMTKIDRKQLLSIVKEDKTNLVLGGAGTGKTTVAAARAKYILRMMKCTCDELIFITNLEQKSYASQLVGSDVAVTSFREVATKIVKSIDGKNPKLIDIDMQTFFEEKIHKAIEKKEYINRLIDYVLFFKFNYGTAFNWQSEEQYQQHLKEFPAITLRGDYVKCYEHMDIANFLFSNGIDYDYDKPYVRDVLDFDKRRYRPAFYLPDFKLYIDCFEIDKKGLVPKYKVSVFNVKTPSIQYREAVNRIREIHREYDTKLLEVYSYEKMDNTLFGNLEKKLQREGVVFSPLDPFYIWDIISKMNSVIIPELVQLFIALFKLSRSRGLNDEELLNTNRSQNRTFACSYKRNESILSLFIPLYKDYMSMLDTPSSEAFTDEENLIYKAEYFLRHNRFISPYKYIIVDNYQNITKPQLALLKALKEQKDSYIFCTADDWQCLGGQMGSDVNFTIDFELYWGSSETSCLENCYRNSFSITNVSKHFITQNKDQLRKMIFSTDNSLHNCIEIIEADNYIHLVEATNNCIFELSQSGTVALIGRYRNDLDLFMGKIPANTPFYTVFQAANITADYIIIINNLKTEIGFPCTLQSDDVLELVSEKNEVFKNSQERRLFYIAITRAKKKVVLLCIKDCVSEFVEELKA